MMQATEQATVVENTPPIKVKYRRLFIPLQYREPTHKISNRAARRELEDILVQTARLHIKKHIAEVAHTFGQTTMIVPEEEEDV